MNMRRIIFRAEGNRQTGLGHISRCLALAELLKGKFRLAFASQAPDEFTCDIILKDCEEFLKLEQPGVTGLLPLLKAGDTVVLDGYGFNGDDEKHLKAAGAKVITIDDLHNREFFCDVILNYCGGIDPAVYQKQSYTRLCLGPDFLILREPFFRGINEETAERPLGRIFLSPGGSDPFNLAGRSLYLLLSHPFTEEVHLVTGAMNPHLGSLKELSGKDNRAKLHINCSSEEVKSLLDHCGLAITTASVAAWEAASTRLALCITAVADNQQNILQFFTQNGLALGFQTMDDLRENIDLLHRKPELTRQMQQSQCRFVHGGSEKELLKLFGA